MSSETNLNLPQMRGGVVEWNRDRGYGYVRYDGRRLFLHVKDCKDLHRRLEVGDEVAFAIGKDRQGRACAQEATLINIGARLSAASSIALGALLIALYHWLGMSAMDGALAGSVHFPF